MMLVFLGLLVVGHGSLGRFLILGSAFRLLLDRVYDTVVRRAPVVHEGFNSIDFDGKAAW